LNRWTTGVLLLVPLLASCGKPDATGEANSIVFASAPDLWAAAERQIQAALAPRYPTLRGEQAFAVTHADPAAETWTEASAARQIILVGTPTDAWMEPILADQDSVPEPPSMLQVEDVWAKGQRVTLLILPEANASAMRAAVPALSDLIDQQYRQGAIQRLYASGVDAELGRTLRAQVGFAMQIPVEFDVSSKDSIHVFRLGSDSSEVVRQVTVTWKSPPPPDLYADGLLQWRREVGRTLNGYSQTVTSATPEMNEVRWSSYTGYEVQALWRNPSDAALQGSGPFIMRAVHCPTQDRIYLIDGWVHAPPALKYEGLIQLETMLSTFECVQ
jgi:hypothetical protein